MQVQINLSDPFEFSAGDRLPAFAFTGNIVVAVDPGKTNMAMTVGTPDGDRLAILQFRAPGSAYNNSQYCHDFKDFLSRYLNGCHIACFGIESAISKKGMNHHHSSMVLTEIRANLIDLAYTLTGKPAIEVNNWSWKYAILPEGYRSQSEKGSARYYDKLYKSYGNADVTDSVCIFEYVVKKYCGTYTINPDASEEPLAPVRILVRPLREGQKNAKRFLYNPNLSLKENAIYFANRTWQTGTTTVDIDKLSIEEIYSYAKFFLAREGDTLETVAAKFNEATAEVVVVRC